MEANIQQLWKQCLGEIQVEVSDSTFQTMLAQVQLLTIDAGIARMRVQHRFWQQQIETRYYNLLKNILEKHSGENLSLVFEVGDVLPVIGSTEDSRQKRESTMDELPLFAPAKPTVDEMRVESAVSRAHLMPGYTFESFAVGSSNQMAFAAAEAVSQSPGRDYNPLFIWGGVGVGKTHLMHAIGHVMLQKNPGMKAIACPGEEFTNEIVEAIRTKTTQKFKEKYRRMDLLLLDDVQFLAGKDTAQEEFFHTFYAIQQSGGQVVLTSDRPPSEIQRLEDRLRSRFEAGLIVDVDNPDFELRTAILLIKSQLYGMELPMEAAQAIAEQYDSAREMEGFLKQLQLRGMNGRIPITLQMVGELLGRQQEEMRVRRDVRPTDIVRATSDMFGVKPSELKGKRRKANIVQSRQVAMYIMRHELGLQYEAIAEYFEKDHTTVMHSVQKIEENVGKSQDLDEKLLGIKKTLS